MERCCPSEGSIPVGFLRTPLVWFGIGFPGLEGLFPVDPISAASVSEEEKGPGLRPGRRDPSPLGHHPPLPNLGLIHAWRHLHSELLQTGLVLFTGEDYMEPKDKHISAGRN